MEKRVEIKPGDQSWVGKRISLVGHHWFIEITAVGREYLLGKVEDDNEQHYLLKPNVGYWILYEDPKPAQSEWMSPALETHNIGKSDQLHKFGIISEESTKKPLNVQIRRDSPEYGELELFKGNEFYDKGTAIQFTLFEKINEIIRALNSLRTIEGELFVRVEK